MRRVAVDLRTPSQETCGRIHGFATQLLPSSPVPGGAVVVADRDGVLAQACFGYADLGRKEAMTPDRLFQIGSISKVFTGLLVTQLAEEGALALDDPAGRYLPWLAADGLASSATLTSLLNHTSGLVVGPDSMPDELAMVWHSMTGSAGSSRGRFHYSNLGYLVLGLVASTVGGRTLPELVAERLLEPMGMSGSVGWISHEDRARFAVGYGPSRHDRPWAPGDELVPAPWFEATGADGNVGAPAPDMARLVMLLLAGGVVDGAPVVSERAVAAMIGSLAPTGEPVLDLAGLGAVTQSRYGLGINVEVVEGHRCLTHGGGMVGYATFLLVDLTAGVGVFVGTNTSGENQYAELLARAAHADLLRRLANRPIDPLPAADPARVLGGPESALTDCLGTFVSADSPVAGPAEISLRADGPEVLVDGGGGAGRLYRTLSGRYVTDHPGLRTYHLDPSADPRRGSGPGGWLYGPDHYVADGDRPGPVGSRASAAPAAPHGWRALCGRYRSFSPWFPELRIFVRGGRLWLSAAAGVEAPSNDQELVELTPGTFRIGTDAWLPERLTVGPEVDGQVAFLVRDGCAYSRTVAS